MTPEHRSRTSIFVTVALAFALIASVGACRAGFEPDPCYRVTCSDHGQCEARPGGDVTCRCDYGYVNEGPEACVPEDWRWSCANVGDCDDQRAETEELCGPTGDCSFFDCLGCGHRAGVWSMPRRLAPSDSGDTGDVAGYAFGSVLAHEGDLLAVSATGEPASATSVSQGAVHVYQLVDAQWQHRTRLIEGVEEANTGFGRSLLIDGDRLFVGAPTSDREGENQGAVYLYRANAQLDIFTLETTLTVSGWQVQAGRSLAGAGEWLFVGGVRAVYVFRLVNGVWIAAGELSEPGAHRFGYRLAFDGQTLVVGDDWFPDTGSDSGALFIYTLAQGTTWTLRQRLTEADTLLQDTGTLGVSIAVAGEWLLAGSATTPIEGHPSMGALHLFRLLEGRWRERQFFSIPKPEWYKWNYLRFGSAVALLEGELFGGAPAGRAPDGIEAGNVSHYRLDGAQWVRGAKLYAPQTGGKDRFGASLVARADMLIVGAPGDDLDAEDGGAVYVYQR